MEFPVAYCIFQRQTSFNYSLMFCQNSNLDVLDTVTYLNYPAILFFYLHEYNYFVQWVEGKYEVNYGLIHYV